MSCDCLHFIGSAPGLEQFDRGIFTQTVKAVSLVPGFHYQFPDLRFPAGALHLRSLEFGKSRTLSFGFSSFEGRQLGHSRNPDPSNCLILLYTELIVLETHQFHAGCVVATLTSASIGNDNPPSYIPLTAFATRGVYGPTREKTLSFR